MEIVWRLTATPVMIATGRPAVSDDGSVPTVLVVEDERDIRELLRRYLERAGHAVLSAHGGAEALRVIMEARLDLVLLDLGLPDIDGMDVLVAAKDAGLAVIALTARSSLEDRLTGLQRGADDYVTKPFSPQEVVLRVAAVLARRAPPSRAATFGFGAGRLTIDHSRHEAWFDGVLLELTPTEWGVLTTLTDTPGRVYSRAEIVNRVRGYEFAGYERTVDSHIKNLRHKIGAAGSTVVETVLGVGYRLGLERDA
jgi:DNA-binding response OmpR family regulator